MKVRYTRIRSGDHFYFRPCTLAPCCDDLNRAVAGGVISLQYELDEDDEIDTPQMKVDPYGVPCQMTIRFCPFCGDPFTYEEAERVKRIQEKVRRTKSWEENVVKEVPE